MDCAGWKAYAALLPVSPTAWCDHERVGNLPRLAHGWRLECDAGVAATTIRNFVRPAVQAIPRALASRMGRCRIRLAEALAAPQSSSRWTRREEGLEIELACQGTEPHDLGMELLRCVGQALWGEMRAAEREAWLKVLGAEIEAGAPGEIDEDALREKRRLLLSPASARNPRRLERYARACFASTAAEYAHCLWHDVTVRSGPEHLPPEWLKRRLELLARWFPPDRGYRLFGRRRSRAPA